MSTSYSLHHSQAQSARALYPSFLSVQESLLLQLKWAWHGIVDAFRWDLVISTISSDAEIRANILKSLLLNVLSLTSIYTFDLLLLPLVQDQQRWLHRNVGWFYQALWLFPVIGLSFYLNSSWCTVIAKRAYALQYGNRALSQQQPATYTGMLKSIATSAYRVVMVFTSVVVSFALENIPYVGPIVGFFFLCWVDAYYCFEFVWIARGMNLSRRIRHLEERWAYYLTFGLPTAALCTWGNTLANAALFALVFPLFIIMAMHARPLPIDPYSPIVPNASQSDVIRHPSPFVPIRLPIFALVLFLNDWIVKILTVGGGGNSRTSRGRAFSDAAENAEEGSVLFDTQSTSTENKPTRARIHIGRRKLD
ncbi:EI24-domain-containing protein [Dendrothele bispora CBS 962.96]|uniref:EI24-domain-containing protein n=1 Tax=Dendrothele bispora (strain CBS 962.96) TaxID=1314807 RepID=A0A4S8LRW0_DENBC|nr:EI24-domain-containing protein [Dendrothele bispora CBS 962.96]THU92154.1 EI24-domain-containing protein [Dendrothele bispora CBS 962.96]